MRGHPPESHSSYHGDDALSGEPASPSCGSVAGDHFPTDGSYSSHEGSSPGIHSVASEFGDLRLNTDVLQHDAPNDPADWIPSPGMLAPGPYHQGIRRWSSAGNPSQSRGHHRFASQQLPSPVENSDLMDNGMGRGRSLTRAVSAPGSTPVSRRHSPYPPQNVDTVYEFPAGEFSPPFHPIAGPPDIISGETTVVKETVTPTKIARAAALRRKNPAMFTCHLCDTTFTTKFKRDSAFISLLRCVQELIFGFHQVMSMHMKGRRISIAHRAGRGLQERAIVCVMKRTQRSVFPLPHNI
jgi:hypothetical protein